MTVIASPRQRREPDEPRERALVMSPFSIPHILDGSKTQTRRLLTLTEFDHSRTEGYDWCFRDKRMCWNDVNHDRLLELCPYGKVGDHLWIKEAWRSWPRVCHEDEQDDDHAHDEHCKQIYVAYKATPRLGFRAEPDGKEITYLEESTPLERNPNLLGPWNNPRFMPKWAARIRLVLTEVRVQSLQDISEADAKAEGCPPFFERYEGIGRDQRICTGELAREQPYRACYACIWDEINGDRALWSTNPWVWALTFRRIAC